MPTIRPATEADRTGISVLLVSVFGQPNESNLVTTLREGGDLAVELVAEDAEGLTGHVALSRLRAPEDWLALAPVSVRTENARQGIGSELIRHALDAARQAGFAAVVVVGDPAYYHRFGFVFDGPAELISPYPPQYTGLYPIRPETAAVRAVLAYPEPFASV